MNEQELEEGPEEYYTYKQVVMYNKLIKYGLAESLAEDCIASRTPNEMETVITFLDRYGRMLKIKKRDGE